MATLTQALVIAFYVAMSLALVYFVHKVLWFVKFRRLQEALVADAERKVREATSEVLSAWDQSAKSSWSDASTGSTTRIPSRSCAAWRAACSRWIASSATT